MHDLPKAYASGRGLQYHIGRSDVVSAHPSRDPGESAIGEVRIDSEIR